MHEFRTTGRVTVVPRDKRNEIDALLRTQVRFRGDPNSETDRRRAHRGIRLEGGHLDGGYADVVSTEAEGAFRTAAGLPPVFSVLQERGYVSRDEMYRVFNMGLGLVMVCDRSRVGEVQALLPEATVVGEVIAAQADRRVIM